ncbi:MAG: hypothetical protein ACO3AY_07510 [Chitinophagaceae bacterium]
MNFKCLNPTVLAFSVLVTGCSDSEEKDKIAAQEVTEHFIEALEDGDIREAKKYCNKDTRDLILQYEEGFVDFFERERFNLKEPKITNGKKAKISARGRTVNIVFKLVKDDSEWKISMDDLEDWEPSDKTAGERTVPEEAADRPATEADASPQAGGEYADDPEEPQFLCDNGQSIPFSWFNDGECDCSDCSDEPYLEDYNETYEPGYDYSDYGSANEDVFYCWNGREIPASWVNDGECDCDDCEDE